MIDIDNAVRDALTRATEKRGELSDFANKLGVTHPTLIRWRDGETNRIKEKLYFRLVMLLRDDLAADDFDRIQSKLKTFGFAFIDQTVKAPFHEPASDPNQIQDILAKYREGNALTMDLISEWMQLSRGERLAVLTFVEELKKKRGK